MKTCTRKWLALVVFASALLAPLASRAQQPPQGSFQTLPNSGTLTYGLPLPALPERAAYGPALELGYVSTPADLAEGFGIGFSLNVPSVRLTNDWGVPFRGLESGDVTARLVLGSERLVWLRTETIDGKQRIEYRPESADSLLRVFRHPKGGTVEVREPDGQLSPRAFMGFQVIYPDGRQEIYSEDPDIAERVKLGDGTFFPTRWPLQYALGPTRELVTYEYTRAKKDDDRTYLSAVHFAGGRSTYRFERAARPRSQVGYTMGFPQGASELYTRLTASFDGEPMYQWCFAYAVFGDGGPRLLTHPDCQDLADKEFKAERERLSASLGGQDMLLGVYRFGRGDAPFTERTPREPLIRFQYTDWTLADLQGSSLVHAFEAPGVFGFGPEGGSELLDVNADGLVDILRHSPLDGKSSTELNLGDDSGGTPFVPAEGIVLERLENGLSRKSDLRFDESPEAQRLFLPGDFNGDGRTDILQVFQDDSKRTRLAFHAGQADTRAPFALAVESSPVELPLERWTGGRTRMVDLNADGKDDLLRANGGGATDSSWTAFLNVTQPGEQSLQFEKLPEPRFPFSKGSDLGLADPTYRFFEVNGDGLVDFVVLRVSGGGERGLCVYENQGGVSIYPVRRKVKLARDALLFGSSDSHDALCGQGYFLRIPGLDGGQNLNAMWLVDVNRDGFVDLVNLSESGKALNFWPGLGQRGFADRRTLSLNESLSVDPQNPWNTRAEDLDGDGAEELLVYESSANGGKLKVIDFNRVGGKNLIGSGLLAESSEGPGLRYAFQYTTSTDEFIRARRQSGAGDPVPRGLPSAMPLVKRRFLSVGGEAPRVSEYQYHSPFTDPRDGAFLGFARTEELEPGDTTQESVVTRRTYSLSGAPTDRALADKLHSEEVFSPLPGDTLARRLSASAGMPPFGLVSASQTKETWGEEPLEVGRLISRHTEHWSTVGGFVRLDSSSDSLCEGLPCPARPTHAQTFTYDASNRLVRSVQEFAAIAGPPETGTSIPARSYERTLLYDEGWEARGVLTLPREEKLVARPSGRLLQESHTTYSPTLPLPVRVSRKVLIDEEALAVLPPHPPEVRAGLSSQELLEETQQLDVFGNVIEAGNSLGVLGRYAYDPTGVLLLAESNALGHTTRYCYGTTGCDLAREEVAGEVRFPARSLRPTLEKTPQGEVRATEFDALHRPLQETDSSGARVSYAYGDAREGHGQLVLQSTHQQAEGPVLHQLSAFRADGSPLGEGVGDENGGTRVSRYARYNRQQRPVFEAVAYRSMSTPTSLFSEGRLPVPPSPMACGTGVGACKEYDVLGRVTRQTDATGQQVTRVAYAPWGHQADADSRAASGTSTRSRLEIARGDEVFATRDESGTVRTFERDEFGRPREIHIPGERAPRLLIHDSEGRLVVSHVPGGMTRVWSRDLRGRVREEWTWDKGFSDWGRTLTTYDGLDRPTLVESSSSSRPEGWDRLSYLYDSRPGEPSRPADVGRLLEATATDVASGRGFTERFSYEPSGRPTSRAILYSGEGSPRAFEERWTYDLDGRVSSYQDPFQNRFTFQRGASGSLSSLEWSAPGRAQEPLLSGLRYDARGQFAAYDVPSSRLHRDYEYAPETGLLMRLGSCVGDAAERCASVLQDVVLERRPDGRVRTQRNGTRDATAYTYSPRGELLEARHGSRVHTYEYGPAGQVLRLGEGEERPFPPAAEAQALALPETGDYRVDGFGRVIAGGKIRSAEYDPWDRLRRVEVDGKALVYGYSASGERISKRVEHIGGPRAAPTQLVLYPSHGTRDDGTQQQSLLRLGTQRPVLIVDGKRVLSLIEDPLGVTSTVLDEGGQRLLDVEYTPYGSLSRVEDTSAGALTSTELVASFTGQHADPDTGLVHMGAREYVPTLASFGTPDPFVLATPEYCVESPLECHLYTYVAHDPINSVDETGLAKAPSRRLMAVGRTPGKHSATGKQVQAAMRAKGMLKGPPGRIKVHVQMKNGTWNWKPLDRKIHMGHRVDAVHAWNEGISPPLAAAIKRYSRVDIPVNTPLSTFGSKSPQARAFMLYPGNYRLEWGPRNSSNGAKLDATYDIPHGWTRGVPPW